MTEQTARLCQLRLELLTEQPPSLPLPVPIDFIMRLSSSFPMLSLLPSTLFTMLPAI